MPTPGEHKTVQARILAYAEAIGWTFVSRAHAETGGMTLGLRHGGAEVVFSFGRGSNPCGDFPSRFRLAFT